MLNASTAYLASQGLTVTAYERWATRIEDLLAGQALSATQLRSAMQVGREVPVSAVLNQMCGEGRLLRDRRWRDGVTSATPTAGSQRRFRMCSSSAAAGPRRPGPMAYDQFTGAIGVFEIGEWVVLGAVYVALAFTWRRWTPDTS